MICFFFCFSSRRWMISALSQAFSSDRTGPLPNDMCRIERSRQMKWRKQVVMRLIPACAPIYQDSVLHTLMSLYWSNRPTGTYFVPFRISFAPVTCYLFSSAEWVLASILVWQNREKNLRSITKPIDCGYIQKVSPSRSFVLQLSVHPFYFRRFPHLTSLQTTSLIIIPPRFSPSSAVRNMTLTTLPTQLLSTSVSHKYSLAHAVDGAWVRAAELMASLRWSPVQSAARNAVIGCVIVEPWRYPLIVLTLSLLHP